jgi:hypothetical protein
LEELAVRTLLALFLAVFVGALGGCRVPGPAYREADLATDPGLVGRWVRETADLGEEDQPKRSLVVEERDVAVRAGRVDDQPSPAAGGRTRRALRITLQSGTPGEPGLTLDAYLLQAEGARFVGVQWGKSDPLVGMLGVGPVHMLWLCERDGDRLVLRWPRRPVAWVSGLHPLDPPRNESPDVPPLDRMKGDGLLFTDDVDRLLRIYGAYAKEPRFWEEAVAYRRAAD